MVKRLHTERSSLDTPFWQNHGQQNHCFWNHGWAGFARIIEEAQGYAWASQAGAVLSNPFASELARDSENPSPILLRKWPCAFAQKLLGENSVLRLASKRGCVVKKHL